MEKLTIRNKKVCVAGLQSPGLALIEGLLKWGAKVTGAEILSPDEVDSLSKKVVLDKVKWIFDPKDGEALLQQDLIITTVGWLTFKQMIHRAEKEGVQVLTELDFVSQFIKGTVVGITGTNGKSTTASFLKIILDEANLKSMVCEGGPSPLGLALGKNNDVTICEINSIRLKESKSFHPHVAVLTSLAEAHPERHRNLNDYFLTKAKVYANQTSNDFLIYHGISEAVAGVLQQRPPQSQLIPFSYTKPISTGIFKQGQELIWKYGENTAQYPLAPFKLKGAHNIENLMAAIAAAKVLEVSDEAILGAIPKMKPLPTRMEPLGKIHQVEYFNDARSANPVSTAWALNALKENVILVAGGQYLKGLDYKGLQASLKKHVKLLLVFGLDRNLFFKDWGDCTETYLTETFKEAVYLAYQKSIAGDQVLFSPGCPPLLHGYGTVQKRGEAFVEILEEIKEHEKSRRVLDSKLNKA